MRIFFEDLPFTTDFAFAFGTNFTRTFTPFDTAFFNRTVTFPFAETFTFFFANTRLPTTTRTEPEGHTPDDNLPNFTRTFTREPATCFTFTFFKLALTTRTT